MVAAVIAPLSYALIASAALNVALGWSWLHARDSAVKARQQVTVVTGERDAALLTAQECSEATDALKKLADQRARDADKARAQARKAAAGRNARADAILSAPPAVPGNDCASARVRVDQWLKGRAAP